MKDWRAEIPDMDPSEHGNASRGAGFDSVIASFNRNDQALIKARRDRMSGPLETVAESKK